MSWTDERKQQLKALWADGLSASEIASELGGVSRNAVIGQVHRLGLSGRHRLKPVGRPRGANGMTAAERLVARATSRRKADATAAARQAARTSVAAADAAATPVGGIVTRLRAAQAASACDDAPEAVELPTEAIELPPEASPFAVTFEQLRADQCRWPIGDPRDLETFRYCGDRQEPSCSYCARHRALASGGIPRDRARPHAGAARTGPRTARSPDYQPFDYTAD